MRCNFVVQDAVPAKAGSKSLVRDAIPAKIKLYVRQDRRPALRSTALLLILIMFSFTLGAETVWQQGFESSSNDNWDFTPIPDPKPNRAVWWGATDQALGGADAYSGDWYWGSWNLQNESHALEFDSVQLSAGYLYTLDFYYFSSSLDPATEYSRYSIEYDYGYTWTNWQNLQPDTNAWTRLSVELPAQASSVRLRVEALYDGFSKYAHWDAFTLRRTLASPMPPDVYNVSALQRRDGSKIVDIHYDIFDANNDPATVSLLLSVNSGGSFDYQPNSANLVGDMGDSIASGIAKHIIWNAGAEGIDFDDSTYRIRVLAEDHTVMGTVAGPVFSPEGGSSSTPYIVSISSATPGASIYYSTDGSDPDESSLLYNNPITIGTTTTLKARAYKELWLPSPLATEIYGIAPEGFVYVPGGTFSMGDTRGEGESDELPIHSVSLSPFYISKYEVKQSEYLAVMANNPAQGFGFGANYPVYFVSWYSALKYCNLRSLNEGLTPVYTISGSTNPSNWGAVPSLNDVTWNAVLCAWSANGYRLLTEAEWEYAARGGSSTPDYMYSGSNAINEVAWYLSNSGQNAHPVGTKAPNALGLYDMSGNVYEWCWDEHGAYGSSAVSDPHGPESNTGRSSRLRRGGYYESLATYSRIPFRGHNDPASAYRGIGFRVCRSGL